MVTKEPMFNRLVYFLVFVCMTIYTASAQDAWNWQGTADGWTGAGGCTVSSNPDFLTMTVTGNQPHIQSPTGLGLMGDDYDSFTVSLRNHTAVGSVSYTHLRAHETR